VDKKKSSRLIKLQALNQCLPSVPSNNKAGFIVGEQIATPHLGYSTETRLSP
jgi:hypothetical protein